MNEEYPDLKDRIQSAFIDGILMLVLMIVFASILDKFENVPDWVRMAIVGFFIVYEPLFMSLGCTLGNLIKGIRVRKHSDSTKKINILQAIIRFPIKFMLGWLSYITIGSSPKRRAIHDMAAGSVMIKL
jgi:uncharacterized RDD family membrane protein YckC